MVQNVSSNKMARGFSHGWKVQVRTFLHVFMTGFITMI